MRRAAWWLAVGLCWECAVWRLPTFPAPWGPPDLLLLALLGWTLLQRYPPTPQAAVLMGACLGGLKDLATGGACGGWTAVFAGTAWLVIRGARMIVSDHPMARTCWVSLCAMGSILAYAVVLGVVGDVALALSVAGLHTLPSALITGLASLVVFPCLRRSLVETR